MCIYIVYICVHRTIMQFDNARARACEYNDNRLVPPPAQQFDDVIEYSISGRIRTNAAYGVVIKSCPDVFTNR